MVGIGLWFGWLTSFFCFSNFFLSLYFKKSLPMEKRPRASLPLLLLLLTIFSVGSWAQDELTCPLHSNNEDYFYRTPRALDRPVEGENPSPLCCKPSWATNNPFAKLTDKMEGEVALCQFKLNK